jgi:hypothetical protein
VIEVFTAEIYRILGDSLAVHDASHRLSTAWKWYVVRGAGFLSVGLLILLMVSGIGLVTGYTYKLFEPTKAWIIHKALAFALCAAIATHVVFLVLDKVVPFSIPQVLIPFISTYKRISLGGVPLGSLWVALGILAMYGTVIVVISSLGYLGWMEKKKKIWRIVHYISYLVMLFAFLHALYLGTDLAKGLLRIIWIIIGVLLLVAVVIRLMRVGMLKSSKSKKKDIDLE